MRSRTAIAVAAAVLAAVLAVPATTAAQDPGGQGSTPPPTTRVVGGQPVVSGQFPWLAAVHIGSSFECGATVVSRTWVLTAAHCVVNSNGQVVSPSSLQIRLKSVRRDTGGEIRRVASIHRHPGYPGAGRENDLAMLRLSSPTTAPAVRVVTSEQAHLDAPGTPVTTIGWGSTSEGGPIPTHARYVSVAVLPDSACEEAYPPDTPLVFRTLTQTCAGYPAGGRDACQGDSGGPLVTQEGGRWVQVGVVSWGRGCGRSTDPGVYHQLTSSTAWVEATGRFGPFAPDGRAFIDQQIRDFESRQATGTDRNRWTATLQTRTPGHMVANLTLSGTYTNRIATVARIYQTALGRYPTTTELRTWYKARVSGTPLAHVAAFPAAELAHLSDLQFVRTLYRNALGGSNGNDALWVRRLRNGSFTRAQAIAHFAQNATARSRMSPDVRIHILWFGLLRRAPTEANVTQHRGRHLDDVAEYLIHTQSYADRFR